MHTVSSYKMYNTTEGAWAAMLEACEQATDSIDLEQYIFSASGIGAKFLQILEAKRASGVKIRMLIDTAGSYGFYQSGIPSKLSRLGIEVRFFNVISPWRIPNIFSWFFRNHKKVLIIDRKVGFTGGTGIGDYMKNWRDTTGRLEGEVVKEMADSFEDMWTLATDTHLFSKIKKFRRYKQRKHFLTNAPYFKKRFLYHALARLLATSKKSIHLTTPYFVPDHKLIKILKKAVKRGVEVVIILPEEIDVPVVASASHSSFAELLKHGVRIFKYHQSILHAKTAVVDGAWATYGSFNLDSLSFRYNYEANAVTTDPLCVAELEAHFAEDLSHSREITYEQWKARPWIRKIQEYIVAPIRGFL